MVEGLVLKKDFAIQFCIVFSREILPPLIGILFVADPIERSEGFGSLAIIEATGSICERFQRVTTFLLIGVVVGELGLPHCLVALGLKWRRVGYRCLLEEGGGASERVIKSARILVIIAD